MTRLSKPVATIETLKRLVTNSDSKYATKDSLSKVATTGNYSDLKGTPTSLKNPNAISFTGGSIASYDGSKSVTVAIPTSLPANGGNASTVNGHTVLSNVPANAKFTDTVYSLPDASTTTKGGVKVGSNITVDTGTISLTADNVTGALGYTPPTHDTHYMTGLKVGATAYATSNAAATNGNVYLNVLDNYTVRDSHKIVGTGATTVTSDANGVITISSTDTNTVYTHPSTHPASMITGLAKVATSGSYADLSNKPTIPTSLPANGGNSTTANGIMPDWTGSLGYNDTNWICAWQSDGKKIKAMNKSVFAASNHTHNYAASSSAGGAATSANKLNTNAGSSTTPTYFYNGVPVACTGISVATVTATTTLNIPGGKIWIE